MGNAAPAGVVPSKSASMGPRAGVSIFTVKPDPASPGETIELNGVGFIKAQQIYVRYNDTHTDEQPQWLNSTRMRSVVPQLDVPSGLIAIEISFDGGQLWNKYNRWTYKDDHYKPPPPVLSVSSSPSPAIIKEQDLTLARLATPKVERKPISPSVERKAFVKQQPRKDSGKKTRNPKKTDKPARRKPSTKRKPNNADGTANANNAKPSEDPSHPKHREGLSPSPGSPAPKKSDGEQRVVQKLRKIVYYTDDLVLLAQTARTLSNPHNFYDYYFNTLPAKIAENPAKYAAMIGNEEAVAAHFEECLRAESNLNHIKVQIILTSVRLGANKNYSHNDVFTSHHVWWNDSFSASKHGFVHAALKVGPWLLDWNANNLLLPQPAVYTDSLSMDVGSIATLKLPEDKAVISKICSVCVEWNRNRTIEQNFNPQLFMDQLFAAICFTPTPGGALDVFMTRLRYSERQEKHFFFIDNVSNITTVFHDHACLDEFCRQREEIRRNYPTPPETLIGTKEDFKVLQMIDRAFWRRHLFDAHLEACQPCSQGCYFGDPRTMEIQQSDLIDIAGFDTDHSSTCTATDDELSEDEELAKEDDDNEFDSDKSDDEGSDEYVMVPGLPSAQRDEDTKSQ